MNILARVLHANDEDLIIDCIARFLPSCNPIDAKPSGVETLTLNLSLPANKDIIIDWGDGNTTKVSGAVSDQNYTNNYAGAGTYPIKFYGDFRALTRLKIETVNIDSTTTQLGALSDLTYFRCADSNTISGDITNLPSSLTDFICYGSNTISGDITNLPSDLTYFRCAGSNTISGDITNLPSGLTDFRCYGSNTISGDITNLPSSLTSFNCTGSNTISDYTTPHTWTTKPTTFILIPVGAGGLSESEIDNLFIDFDADLVWVSGNVITLTGTNAAPSATSAAARTNIAGEGCTITTN